MRIAVRALQASLLLVLTCASAGCFELLTEVRFQADGSVRQVVRYGMNERATTRFNQALRAAPVPGRRAISADSVYEEKAVRDELAHCNAKLDDFETWEDEESGKRFAQIRATFPDHDALRASPLLGTRNEWFFLRGKGEQIRLVCYPLGRDAWRRARFEAAELTTGSDSTKQQVFEARKRELTGMVLKFGIGVPGTVVKASKGLQVAPHRKGVIAAIDVEKIETAADLVKALAPRWEIVFQPDDGVEGFDLATTEPR